MEKYKRRNKILVVISSLILIVLALIISKATYSYLEPIDPDDIRINSEITATGDTLLFTKGTDIAVTLTQDNFNSESGNLVRSVTPQVKLIASNKTNNATANYYVSVNISDNTFQYTNGTSNPEILLTVTDNDGNPLTTCTGLTYTTVGGVSGFDITNKMGVYDFAEQTISTTSSTTGTTKNWTYTVTFINKTTDQSINEDATIKIQAILHKEPEAFCELSPDVIGCKISLSYNPAVSKNVVTLDNGYVYYHDEDLENGANDGSYRYAGANPNNYVCFGSEAATCPAENVYRIIGLMPVDVVTNSRTNPVTTERQMLYKLIKNDYETSTILDMSASVTAAKESTFNGPAGNQPSGEIEGFDWSGSSSNQYNTWGLSTLNTTNLNVNAYGTFSSAWQKKIETVMWKVGGIEWYNNVTLATPMSTIYSSEIVNTVATNSQDNKTELANKIGLLYVSDYGYAAPQSAWTTPLFKPNGADYRQTNIISNNWIYKGVHEWTISRITSATDTAIRIFSNGMLYDNWVYQYGCALRRVFYLTEDTEIDMVNHAGTLADPYRIKNVESYVYWNNNFNLEYYARSLVPNGSGLNGTYATRDLLAAAYSGWSDAPIYIKSTILNGAVIGHETCLFYNNREFCMAPNYWDTDAETSKTKLKTDLEEAYNITIPDSDCGTAGTWSYCNIDDFDFGVSSDGSNWTRLSVYSQGINTRCNVEGYGSAWCSDD